MGKRDATALRTESGSYRELARHVGVSETAVRKRIKSGGLLKCLGKTQKGQPVIADMRLAVDEWNASSKTGVMAPAWGSREGFAASVALGIQTAVTLSPSLGHDDDVDEEPSESADEAAQTTGGAKTLTEAQRLATIQRERKLRLENDVFEGRLVHVDKVSKEAFEAERTIRENMLNMPARISGELAAETDAAKVYIRLDAAIREALNVTADQLLAEGNE